ncbi:Uma2 family endonuclease [Roseofilum sp. BLCC_M154]|uniref:Uma2 family endonuclease n=1 Tax=Roseofilum acuticapitatum BLCC-M154 TaxID=3022444 RepID=A0ABT7AQA0_9CYAN|nr:Uma2 family endonuclease [Roseofilum acuticapitatum]MDJ1169055.1 Uma2 family endonuclease [Roseofilum acuticapitatum BLCC-M154]
MTSLLIKSEQILWPIDLSALIPLSTMSDRQFYEFCRTNVNLQIERNADGEIIIMPPAFADTGNRKGRVFGQLFIWSETDGTGEAFDSSSGFTLPNGAVRSPDAAWILGDRWNALSPEQQASFAPIAPDFVVELRSSSDTLTSLQTKMAEYISNGVRLGLLIDRQNNQVHIYRGDREPQILDRPESVNCEPEMPGFALKMAKIW